MDTAAAIYASIAFPDGFSGSGAQLSSLQKAMLDATPDCIKVVSTDGLLITMNKAGCLALGVAEDSGFGMRWLSLLPEDVHPLGEEALREARGGRSARFPGKSISPDGVRYWDNLLTPLVDASGQVLSILCVSRDVTTKTMLEKQLGEAITRERLLAREMQHRIKNLFSIVSGLIVVAGREAGPEGTARDVTTILREKLAALSRASDAVFADGGSGEGEAEAVDLRTIVHSILLPYGDRCRAEGDPVAVQRSDVTVFALFLHELATNSVKYGALSTDEGDVSLGWTVSEGVLVLTWCENGGPAIAAAPARRGFGSEMVDRIVQASSGSIERLWYERGLAVTLRLPVLPSR